MAAWQPAYSLTDSTSCFEQEQNSRLKDDTNMNSRPLHALKPARCRAFSAAALKPLGDLAADVLLCLHIRCKHAQSMVSGRCQESTGMTPVPCCPLRHLPS